MSLSQKQIDRWSRIRMGGKTHFAITRGLFGYGAPLLIGGTFIQLWMAPNQNVYSLIGGLLVMIPGCLYAGYRFGRRQWDTYEKRYASSGLTSDPLSEPALHVDDISGSQYSDQFAQPPSITEEEFYELAATELEQQTHKTGVWAKAFSDADGSPERARALYIRYRIPQIAEASLRQQQEDRRMRAKTSMRRLVTGGHRLVYGLFSVVCGLVTLFLALCTAAQIYRQSLQGSIFTAVLGMFFGFTTYWWGAKAHNRDRDAKHARR